MADGLIEYDDGATRINPPEKDASYVEFQPSFFRAWERGVDDLDDTNLVVTHSGLIGILLALVEEMNLEAA
jgi:broad specificity phosphatase PhoE